MLILTLGMVMLFVPPAYLSSQILFTAAAAAGGVASISLMLGERTNYFDQMTGYNPFLHAWSLGVEEQFYLIFPVLIWALFLARDRASVATSVLVSLAATSFGLAIWWSVENPTMAFYSLLSRFWELAAGAIVYLVSQSSTQATSGKKRGKVLGGWVVLGLILVSLVLPFNLASPIPAAILPVIATALLLWLGRDMTVHGSGPYKLLSINVLTYVGRISYSLYLWHWPVVVLLRWTVGSSEPWQITLAFLLSFVLGIASYHLIERPCQTAQISKIALRGPLFASIVALVVSYSITTLVIGNERGFRAELPSMSVVSSEFGWQAHELPELGTQRILDLWTKTPRLIVVGDSHAGAISGAAIAAARNAGLGFRIISGCGFSLLEPMGNKPSCRVDIAQSGDVVLFASLSVPRYVDQDGSRLEDPDVTSAENITARGHAYKEFRGVVENLRARGVGIVIRGPEPLFHYIPFRCSDWFNKMNPICRASTVEPRLALMSRAKPAMDSIVAIQENVEGVIVMDVFGPLCSTDHCSIYTEDG